MPPGSAAPSGPATWPPGWSGPVRPRRSGCPEPPGDDSAGGARGDHRRLRRRAADRGHAAHRDPSPAAEGPHPASRHVPDPGRRPARAPDRVHQALTALSEDDQWRPGVIADWKHGPHLLTYRQTEYTCGLA